MYSCHKLGLFFVKVFRNIFELDIRSIALLRASCGFMLIIETLWQLPNIEAFFTNYGVIPTFLFDRLETRPEYFGIHIGNGQFWWIYLLFSIQILVGIFLIIGYRSQLMICIAWFLVVSMQTRAAGTLYGGDVLFRVTLFWAMFLPVSRAVSLDNFLKTGHFWSYSKSLNIFSPATIAYTLQMFFYMFDTALHKWGPVWTKDFTALQYALLNGVYRIPPLGDWLVHQVALNKFLTGFVISIELIAPFLLILPIVRGYGKVLGIMLYWILHLGIASTLSVDLFPFFGIFTIVGLIPSFVWMKNNLKQVHIHESYLVWKWRAKLKEYLYIVAQVFVVICTVLLIFQNLSGQKIIKQPEIFNQTATFLRIDQSWTMFENPARHEGWVTGIGTLKSGKQIDVWKAYIGKDPYDLSVDLPEDNEITFPTEKWHKHIIGLVVRKEAREEKRLRFGWYLCRFWNNNRHFVKSDMDKLQSFDFQYHRVENISYNQNILRGSDTLLRNYSCR